MDFSNPDIKNQKKTKEKDWFFQKIQKIQGWDLSQTSMHFPSEVVYKSSKIRFRTFELYTSYLKYTILH